MVSDPCLSWFAQYLCDCYSPLKSYSIFSFCRLSAEIDFAKYTIRSRIITMKKHGGPHTIDYNNDPVYPNDAIEEVIVDEEFIHVANVARTATMTQAKMYFHFESGTAILLHRPCGIGADSRMPFNRIRLCILRLILVEILRQAVHRTSGVTPDDLPVTVQDACVVAGYFSEACGFGIHIDHKAEQALKRDVVTSPDVRACEFNNLNKGSPDPLAPVGHRAKQRIRRNGQAGLDDDVQILDRFVVSVEAVNMISFLQRGEEGDPSFEDVFALLRRDGKDEYARRDALEACFVEGSKTQKSIKQHRAAVRNNSGNPHARGHTAAELRQCSLDLAAISKKDLGTVFWVPNLSAAKQVTPSIVGLENELRVDSMVFESIRKSIKKPEYQAKARDGKVIRVHKYPGRDANPGEVAEYRGVGDDASSSDGRKRCWVKCILVEEDPGPT